MTPVLDWAKRTIVRFRSSGATASGDRVGAAHTPPRGACDHPAEAARCAAASDLSTRTLTTERVVREKCEPNQKTQIRSDLRGSQGVKSASVVSTVVDTQVEQEEPVTEGSDLGASAPGADVIGPNINGRSAVTRRGERGTQLREPTLQAVRAVANVLHRKCLRARVQPRCTTKRYTIKPGLIAVASGWIPPAIKRETCPRPGLDKINARNRVPHEKRTTQARKLRKSRSGTETLQAVSAGQTQRLETTVETLNVLTRTDTGLQYRKMALESPPTLAPELTSLPAMSWKRFARDMYDGRIEQICILSDVERMESEAEELKQIVTEGADALSAKSKKESFDEQSWDSLKSSPLYEVLREYKDVLPDDIPAELPQDKGVQH
ncbi:unnamed protein product [Phytophthora fragariaefolia]|uniref:Unnamed protein product n=1 Tax=Phytophthora fragariaefolia TaxID=1490495 RepID=A0A9W6XPR1_9STRA|nr:unnamed protein product [Phytophthora fragariaefolia]